MANRILCPLLSVESTLYLRHSCRLVDSNGSGVDNVYIISTKQMGFISEWRGSLGLTLFMLKFKLFSRLMNSSSPGQVYINALSYSAGVFHSQRTNISFSSIRMKLAIATLLTVIHLANAQSAVWGQCKALKYSIYISWLTATFQVVGKVGLVQPLVPQDLSALTQILVSASSFSTSLEWLADFESHNNIDYSQCLPGTASSAPAPAPSPSSPSQSSSAPAPTSSPGSNGSGLPYLGGVNTAGYDFSVATNGSFSGPPSTPPPSQYAHFANEGANLFRIRKYFSLVLVPLF